ncbi:hypothetical protein EJ110_NYTH43027 [Nymphaea thermarum]|nr:hypothetical protein EJ110_NYTH43027 [Nymphaea thermarum]
MGGEYEELEVEVEEGCQTPKHAMIPATFACPPPPKKKAAAAAFSKKKAPPPNGYFHPPDLELFFASTAAPRRQAWA